MMVTAQQRRANGETDPCGGEAGGEWPRLDSWLLGVAAVAALSRLLLIRDVYVSPDGAYYLRLATNLVGNYCYSDSDPSAGECHPAWGSQPPGYPLFLAGVQLLLGSDPAYAVWTQTIVFAAALWYLMLVSARSGIDRRVVMAAGVVVSLSPASAGYSRWVLTETLSAAAVLWLLAECLRSLGTRDIAVIRFAAPLGLCAILRWDLVWAGAAFVLVTLVVCPPWLAMRKVLATGMLVAVPYSVMLGRAVFVDLPLLPSALNATSEEVPDGVRRLWRTAALSQNATYALIFSVWDRNYGLIAERYDGRALLEPRQGPSVEALLLRLAAVPDGEAVPADLDLALSQAAERITAENRWQYAVTVLWTRAVRLWTDVDGVTSDGYTGQPASFLPHMARFERVAVLLFLVGALGLTWSRQIRVLVAAFVVLAVLRTGFLVVATALEIRYLAPIVPAMEFTVVLAWGSVLHRGRARWRGDSM